MGLDSLSETNWVPTRKSSNSAIRSKSMNFMDYLLKFDPDLKQKKNNKKNTTERLVVKKKEISQENLSSCPRADREGDFGATLCVGEISNLVW
ncbi:hypothetical protein QYF36_021369 [Acer negundo]|nr:hypothetical protein QYF36_021369 [Acer negundo]